MTVMNDHETGYMMKSPAMSLAQKLKNSKYGLVAALLVVNRSGHGGDVCLFYDGPSAMVAVAADRRSTTREYMYRK